MTLYTPTHNQLEKLDEILGSLEGRRIGLLGLGVAGRAMAAYLVSQGVKVVAADLRTELADDASLSDSLSLRLGPMSEETFADVEALVISPGAHPEQPAVEAVRRADKPVFGELELVGNLGSQVIAITGTNGKSTTTAMIGSLVEGLGKSVFVGGNLGDPLSRCAASGESVDVLVLELSSFQLETAYRYRPDVSLVLNVTPDHGDRYDDLEEYAHTKSNILSSQTKEQVAVLSADDKRVASMASQTEANVRWFSTLGHQFEGDGFYLEEDSAHGVGIYAGSNGLPLAHDKLFGRHNRENALAAFLAVDGLGIVNGNWDDVLKAYQKFAGLEHRLEWVRELQGVRFINDSKATNDEAAAVALRALPAPVVLLAGGRSKGGGYDALVEASKDKVTRVIAFGEAGPEIFERFSSEPLEITQCGTMAEAVHCSMDGCSEGTTVVLAPACSSFDEFSNYGVRGREYKAAVLALGEGKIDE
jgi:UDP-N-acetylmuramoylalanine--D-glutamate ligase